MPLSSAELTAWVGSFLWPLARIGAMLSTAPVFSSRLLPQRVKLMLALVLTWVMMPLIDSVPAVDPLSFPGLMIIVQQVLIGLAMGLVLRLVFGALEIGGHVVAMQMGLGFASLVDPNGGGQSTLLSHLYFLLSTLVFLTLDGHLILIRLLAESFAVLPIGVTGLSKEVFWLLVQWSSQMFIGAVLIALPAIASLMVVNMAFGVMTRVSPQLNIFAVGFPITLLLGMLIVLYGLPALLPQLDAMFNASYQFIRHMLQ